jgi:hypothetical protein
MVLAAAKSRPKMAVMAARLKGVIHSQGPPDLGPSAEPGGRAVLGCG